MVYKIAFKTLFSNIVDITGGNIQASDSAFNLYSKGATGVIRLSGTTLRTGQRSLLFFSEDGGTFDLTNVNATIAGGADSSSRGTAFYYSGNNTPLTKTDLENYFQTTFGGLTGKLTLNMESGSRLFIVRQYNNESEYSSNSFGVTCQRTDSHRKQL